MSHEENVFDTAMLAELIEALDAVVAAATTGTGVDRADAHRRLKIYTSADLLRRHCRLDSARSNVQAWERYRVIADGLREILSAWSDAPQQVAMLFVPEDLYAKLHPLYLQALDRSAPPHLGSAADGV